MSAVALDKEAQRYILVAMNHYVEALSLGMKHVYQALPRLLSMWFEFTTVGKSKSTDLTCSSEQKTGKKVAYRLDLYSASLPYLSFPSLQLSKKHKRRQMQSWRKSTDRFLPRHSIQPCLK